MIGKWHRRKISNVYYTNNPRTIGSNMQRFGMQIGMDSLSNVMKEFWPDIKQRLFQGHSRPRI